MTDFQVVVIGAGIMGSLTAIALADAGVDVVLIDRNVNPMESTSRWNEGKIHLGYCYLGDPSFDSVNLMLDGAACFIDEIERLTGNRIQDNWFSRPFAYIVDPLTQFPVDTLWQRSQQLSVLLKKRASNETGLRRFVNSQTVLERLDPDTASSITGLGRIGAAWKTSELAVDPQPVATLIKNALSEREIPLINTTVRSVAMNANHWCIDTDDTQVNTLAVVNASWESRLLLDQGVTGKIEPFSIRYKYAIFGHKLTPVAHLVPSTRIVGPFGDVTPYHNGESYLSWYPAGMVGLSNDGTPPRLPPIDPDHVARQMLSGLGLDAAMLTSNNSSWELRGGFVVAYGHGDIDGPESPLHARSHPGAFELAPGYISVDTGKYSLGPLMAKRSTALVNQYLDSHKLHSVA